MTRCAGWRGTGFARMVAGMQEPLEPRAQHRQPVLHFDEPVCAGDELCTLWQHHPEQQFLSGSERGGGRMGGCCPGPMV
jgi:hypothetical protein